MKLRYNMHQRRWLRYYRYCLSIGEPPHNQCCGISLEACMPNIRFWDEHTKAYEP
jgi:hypothetical protein